MSTKGVLFRNRNYRPFNALVVVTYVLFRISIVFIVYVFIYFYLFIIAQLIISSPNELSLINSSLIRPKASYTPVLRILKRVLIQYGTTVYSTNYSNTKLEGIFMTLLKPFIPKQNVPSSMATKGTDILIIEMVSDKAAVSLLCFSIFI